MITALKQVIPPNGQTNQMIKLGEQNMPTYSSPRHPFPFSNIPNNTRAEQKSGVVNASAATVPNSIAARLVRILQHSSDLSVLFHYNSRMRYSCRARAAATGWHCFHTTALARHYLPWHVDGLANARVNKCVV